MKKQKKSLTKRAKDILLERTEYQSPYGSPEIIECMKQSEAREWIRRYRQKIGEAGSVNAQSWWLQVCVDIERIRGKDALDDLRRRMNAEKSLQQKKLVGEGVGTNHEKKCD